MKIGFDGQPLLDSDDFDRIYLQQCRKEGLLPAMQHMETGEVFVGANHRDAYAKRRVKLLDEGASLGDTGRMGTPTRYRRGYVDKEGEFLTRDQVEKIYGFRLSEETKEYSIKKDF